MPKKIIYQSEGDAVGFDKERFFASLHRYGDFDEKAADKALEHFEAYDPLHVSCLIEIGVLVLPEEAARKYYEDHLTIIEDMYSDFERLRRITGYLVGTLSRWNNAKREEEKARVKHSVVSPYSLAFKSEIEAEKLDNSVASQF